MKAFAAVIALLLVLPACGTESPDTEPRASSETTAPTAPDTPTAECVQLPQPALDSIAEGFKVPGATIVSGHAVELSSPQLGMRWAVALEISGNDVTRAVLGMGEAPEGGGPIMAADDAALSLFQWGDAATDGSPADVARDAVASSDEASAALACV